MGVNCLVGRNDVPRLETVSLEERIFRDWKLSRWNKDVPVENFLDENTMIRLESILMDLIGSNIIPAGWNSRYLDGGANFPAWNCLMEELMFLLKNISI